MEIVIDLSTLPDASNPFEAMWFLFRNGGWLGVVYAFMYGLWSGWLTYIRERFEQRIVWVLLAIDIPKTNEQTPKAVEHIFSHFTGFFSKGTLKERYLLGHVQLRLSLEIVSIEGYVQFLIRTPSKYRDLVEAAIYAQYPDAEITEVEDYINTVPKPLEFPHNEWDLWGTELKLTKPDVYPIKTYPEFEDPIAKTIHDPMASILEILSRLGPGEQCWLQLVITPAGSHWAARGIRIIKKLIHTKEVQEAGPLGKIGQTTGGIARGIQETVTATLFTPSPTDARAMRDNQPPTLMQHLPPHERFIVESIGRKIGKLGFVTKFRLIYLGRKEVFERSRGVAAVSGALSQFNTQDLNAFFPHKQSRSSAHYFFVKYRKKWRQRRILWGYRSRSIQRGWTRFILNTEELASLWHFPMMTVKAPFVQKTEAKRGQPPISLPVESFVKPATPPSAPISANASVIRAKSAPPPTLPID